MSHPTVQIIGWAAVVVLIVLGVTDFVRHRDWRNTLGVIGGAAILAFLLLDPGMPDTRVPVYPASTS